MREREREGGRESVHVIDRARGGEKDVDTHAHERTHARTHARTNHIDTHTDKREQTG